LAEDARRDADLADVVEERAELELLHALRRERHLRRDAQRKLLNLARVRGRIAVVRLGGVRERLHRREHRLPQPREAPRVRERELRLVREAREEAQLLRREAFLAVGLVHDEAAPALLEPEGG